MNSVLVKTSEEVLPIIDITPLYDGGDAQARKNIGDDIVAAAETYGFFYISGYSIPENQIQKCFDQSIKYFSQSPDFKDKQSINLSDRFQGYEPPNKRENKEAYVLGPERRDDDPLVAQGLKYHGSNRWPDEGANGLGKWKVTMLDQMDAMLKLAKTLNRALALGLGVDEGYFDARSDDPMYTLRLLHYPPRDKNLLPCMAEHTDWGALSLLIQDDIEGLEILTPEGTWHSVTPIKNTIVVNIGELVARWTNDRLKATKHCVYNKTNQDRYSIAFFLDMNHDAVIAPIETCETQGDKSKYEPIKVSEFIDLMHSRDYADI